jgi:hypothetical protein
MLLNENQVIELLRKQKTQNKIYEMQSYESRLKVMSEPLFFRELESEQGWSEIKLAINEGISW